MTLTQIQALSVGDRSYRYHPIADIDHGDVAGLPYSLKVLLENLARHAGAATVSDDDVAALAAWDPQAAQPRELAFTPARILLQDFTGVPAVVDLAAMRDAIEALGGDASSVNPLVPVELVIDHSVVADVWASDDAFARNVEIEYERNRERYQFLRWGQQAFDGLTVVPPGTGICHQVNLEHLARVVFVDDDGMAYPDTLVGTDSHTPMVNGLGVLGWGVGGIEAEAAMLGQPISMLTPRVVGFELTGELPEGSTATDLVLTVTELLRGHGVVGKFVEFHGPGVSAVSLENRATIGNMTPEYGATCAIFPIDAETLRYLRFTGRADEQVALVEAYAKEQGLWHDPSTTARYSEHLSLDLSTVVPSLAGPARPQDRVPLDRSKAMFADALADIADRRGTGGGPKPGVPAQQQPVEVRTGVDEASAESFPASDPPALDGDEPAPEPERAPRDHDGHQHVASPRVTVERGEETFELSDGSVVIAAITSCTNTSNPSVMVAAGLLAKKAVERGLRTKPWVKTTLAPGSQVVTDYFERAGLTPYLDELGYQLVGYGCTTCIGNSGPLAPDISAAIGEGDLAVVSVLSGNRNFEGRIHPEVRMNYLASPPLVVAYGLAGRMDVDLFSEPLGTGDDGEPVHLRDIWPTPAEVQEVIDAALETEMFTRRYAEVYEGDEQWRSLPLSSGDRYEWSEDSTYIRQPTFFDGMGPKPAPITDVEGARVLALLSDSVTTDHISPAGAIEADGPAGSWLQDQGVPVEEFNSYGSRRGNHEVMVRGTFANIRLRNQLAPGTEGGVTTHQPSGEQMTIYEAAERYRRDGVPLVVLAGAEYGSGSSRDWAAKGTLLLGVRAVIATSFERIHRSNLIGMGVLPLELVGGQDASSLGLTGREVIDIRGLDGRSEEDLIGATLSVEADGTTFEVRTRIDTPMEAAYYRHGGILQYVLRDLAS
ncbi:aconitate hydratase [Acidimicrobiia bacterium EGI L10123]|uniref:aconitate hydratase n=1 Tax=Salinilacustrithrix flava TaxID=2957203 RepID=UPI003D7C2236|nr:aconitate hydratase [Acidimicrobiia bacterium EGI L10123]